MAATQQYLVFLCCAGFALVMMMLVLMARELGMTDVAEFGQFVALFWALFALFESPHIRRATRQWLDWGKRRWRAVA